jgi:uncharacterized damage-inducible protein DinB
MDKASIAILYEYNVWANNRIITAAQTLPPAELTRPRTILGETIFSTLDHILDAEWTWRVRCQEGLSPPAEEYPTLALLAERWAAESLAMSSFLEGLAESDLDVEIHYTNSKGNPYAEPLWQILMHMINHGTQHRSEAAVFLTDAGASPGDMDLILFLREREK